MEVVTHMETPEAIAGRLANAYGMFGDAIRYAGPDCGLGSWPYQEMAQKLLSNTAKGIEMFCKNQ